MSDILSVLAAAQAAREAEQAAAAERAQAAEQAARDAAQAAWLARSPKQQHDDEIAAHQKWIANPGTASYFWLTVKDGVVTQEWDDTCNCDDRAEIDPNGHTKRGWPEAPFSLVAHPMSPATQKLPSALELAQLGHVYDIGVGDVPIWEHRNRFTQALALDAEGKPMQNPDGSPMIVVTEEEAVVYGVRRANGSEEITTVDHTGDVMQHESHEAALAHMPPYSAFAPKELA